MYAIGNVVGGISIDIYLPRWSQLYKPVYNMLPTNGWRRGHCWATSATASIPPGGVDVHRPSYMFVTESVIERTDDASERYAHRTKCVVAKETWLFATRWTALEIHLSPHIWLNSNPLQWNTLVDRWLARPVNYYYGFLPSGGGHGMGITVKAGRHSWPRRPPANTSLLWRR